MILGLQAHRRAPGFLYVRSGLLPPCTEVAPSFAQLPFRFNPVHIGRSNRRTPTFPHRIRDLPDRVFIEIEIILWLVLPHDRSLDQEHPAKPFSRSRDFYRSYV